MAFIVIKGVSFMKSKKWIVIIVVAILAIILAIGGIVYFANKDVNKPEDVLKQYVAYINEQQYDKMYELLSIESKSKTSKEDFLARNKKIYEGIEVKNLGVKTIVADKQDKSKITYQMEMNTLAGKISFENTMSFTRQEDKKYYINWSSSLIFPDLGDTDKIRVTTTQGARGRILDRNNHVLAEQGIIKRVGLVPGKMENRSDVISKTSKLLGVSKEFIEEELSASYVQEDTFVPIKTMSNEDEEKIEDKLLAISGIMISDIEDRVYPYGEATSHLIGYIRGISEEELKENSNKDYTSNSLIGKSGIEKIFEAQLKGTNGAEIYIVDSNENKLKTIATIQQKPGKDVKLTIDVNLQNKIYQELKRR